MASQEANRLEFFLKLQKEKEKTAKANARCLFCPQDLWHSPPTLWHFILMERKRDHCNVLSEIIFLFQLCPKSCLALGESCWVLARPQFAVGPVPSGYSIPFPRWVNREPKANTFKWTSTAWGQVLYFELVKGIRNKRSDRAPHFSLSCFQLVSRDPQFIIWSMWCVV